MNALLRKGRRLLRSNRRFMQVTRFIALAMFNQRILIFRPNRWERGSPSDVGIPFEREELRIGAHAMRAWWMPHRRMRAAVVLLPGRATNISHELDTFEYLRTLDVSVLAVDYPGFGGSPGIATEDGCYAAASAAWEWIVRKGFAPESVILYGQSLGASVAVWLAARVPCRGVVFHGGFSSIPDLAPHYFPSWLVRGRCDTMLDAASSVAACRCPVVVVHARDDRLVPISLGRRVYQCAHEPKTMIELPGDHFDSEWQRHAALRREWERLIDAR